MSKVEQIISDALDKRLGYGDLTAWELPIVVACRDLLADTVAQLPLVAYRGSTPVPRQPPMLTRPDPAEPRWQSLAHLVHQMTGHGYAWLMPIGFLADGYPAAVRVLDAATVAAEFDPSGRIETVWYEGTRYEPGRDGIVWSPYRVTARGTLGTSPLGDCWRAVEYLAALWQMAGSFWEAGFPSLAIVIEQALNATQRKEIKDETIAAWRRRHEPSVFDRNARLEPVGSNAVDSQLVESIAVANQEIARAFGMAPSLVNVAGGDSLTYSTTEQEFARWLKLGLGGWTMRIGAAFSEFTPYGVDVRCDTSALLATDVATRLDYYDRLHALGVLEAGDIAAAEGLSIPHRPAVPADGVPALSPN